MSEHVYFLTIGMFLGTVLIVFAMRYYSVVQQARARLMHEDSYRTIAAQAVENHAATAAAVSSIQTSLADIAARIVTIERVLKEVD
jgi:hypothetical protein